MDTIDISDLSIGANRRDGPFFLDSVHSLFKIPPPQTTHMIAA